MNRTPIKIPGKKKRDTGRAATTARKALNLPPGQSLNFGPTVKSSQTPDSVIQSVKQPKKRSLKHIKSRRKMSPLEKLPTELLEEVFLYSMNLDLPRSSPVIGGKLTSELLFTRSVIAAFGPTWEVGFGKCIPQVHSRQDPQGIIANFGGGNCDLQSAILRCRWASLSVLQKSQQNWIHKHCKATTYTIIPFLKYWDSLKEEACQIKRLDQSLSPVEFFDEDFAAFSLHCQERKNATEASYANLDCYFDVAEGIEIPQSLLLGPWTEEQIKYLFWLVKGGARLKWLNSTSGETAMLGFKSAVVSGDMRVINLLFWAGLSDCVGVQELVWVIRNASQERHAVLGEVISLWEGSPDGQNMLLIALQDMREEAEAGSDVENADFVGFLFERLAKSWEGSMKSEEAPI